eukprot:Gb_03881 [translate_table: standard]
MVKMIGCDGFTLSQKLSQVSLQSRQAEPETSSVLDFGELLNQEDDEHFTRLAADDETDFILSQDMFCTPDYVTPDDQQILIDMDINKENVLCPTSPEKSNIVRSKRRRPECLSSYPSDTNQACPQRVATLRMEAFGSDDSRNGRLSASGQKSKQNYVSRSAVALRCRVMSPPCIKNPYLAENEDLNDRLKSSLRARSPACLTPILGESCLSRYRADFHELEEIGRGNFSRVYKVLKRIDGCCYAVKRTVRQLQQESERKQALMEVQALAALGSHDNVVGYYTAWFENDHLYIQMELCDCSLANPNMVLTSETEYIEVMYQIAQALEFIHEHGVAHLDLKPDNIYVRGGTYKLGDFGRATLINGTLHIEEGDARYMPHEILNDNYEHLDKADIFSLGATIYELVRRMPLPASGTQFQLIREGKINLLPSFSIHFRKLLQDLLDPDPVKRPSAKELLKNPIFKKVHGADASKRSARKV